MDFDELYRREQALARHKENRGRGATVFADVETSGVGTIEFDERIEFGLTYISRPFPTYGSEVDSDAVRDLLGIDSSEPCPLPSSSGHVVDWDTNERGHFVGAWVAVVVTYPLEIPVQYNVAMRHYFTFVGPALKDVPVDHEVE